MKYDDNNTVHRSGQNYNGIQSESVPAVRGRYHNTGYRVDLKHLTGGTVDVRIVPFVICTEHDIIRYKRCLCIV